MYETSSSETFGILNREQDQKSSARYDGRGHLSAMASLASYRTGFLYGLVVNGSVMMWVAWHIATALAWVLAGLYLGGFAICILTAVRAQALIAGPVDETTPARAQAIERLYAWGSYPLLFSLAALIVLAPLSVVSFEVVVLMLLNGVAVMGVVTEWSSERVRAATIQLTVLGGAAAVAVLLSSHGLATALSAIGVLGYTGLCIHIAVTRNDKDMALIAAVAGQERLAAAKRSEAERLAAALRFMSHGVMVTDSDGKVALVNDRFRSLLDLPPSVFPVGAAWQDMIRLSPRIGLKTSEGRRGIIARTGALVAANTDVATVLRLDDGSILDIDIARMEDSGHLVVLRDVTGETAVRDALEREARRCPMTGLANRRAFEEALSSRLAARPAGMMTVLVLGDLKNFKAINDTYGHPTGDRVLTLVAIWLQAAVTGAFVGRLGGDEFAVIADVRDDADAHDWARRVHTAMRGVADLDGLRIEVEGRVGYARAPTDATTAVDLFRRADLALLASRDPLSPPVASFTPEQEQAVVEQLRQERALVQVLANDAAGVAYQPWFRLGDGVATGVEALVRWPVQPGFLAPPAGRMVALAEASGQVGMLREQVMRRAMAEIAARSDRLDLALNISALELQQTDFAERLLAAAASAGFDVRRLHFEITESAIHRNLQQSAMQMAKLRAAGARVAIDDFGSGFSSLASLRRLPVDRLKLDRSLLEFEQDARPSVVLGAAITMGIGLGLEVVAEGIETRAQLLAVAALDVDAAQGFLLARPVPIADLDKALSQGRLALRTILDGNSPPAVVVRG